jgi:hypothetical protein
MLALPVILVVAAGVAFALPRALDGPSSQTSADRRSSAIRVPAVPPAARAKAKSTRKVPRQAHRKAAARRAHAAQPANEAKPAAKKHAAAPAAATKPLSKHRPAAVHSAQPPIPDFVWVPAKNASGYLIEFRSGSKLVLRVRTRAARLHFSRRRLHHGRYRWLVWALNHAGSRVGEPLVVSIVRIQ